MWLDVERPRVKLLLLRLDANVADFELFVGCLLRQRVGSTILSLVKFEGHMCLAVWFYLCTTTIGWCVYCVSPKPMTYEDC